jgi:N-acetylglutamate synthase-like GNAT family acetyltransferase
MITPPPGAAPGLPGPLTRVTDEHVPALTAFLGEADLTLSGLDAPSVRLWIDRGRDGRVTGSTGYELSADRRHALIRSVAVSPAARRAGYGSALARFALARAAEEGAGRAWLFSRRSGPFWQKLGFASADRDALTAALPDTHQVRLFTATGQLASEVAWSRPLAEG